uniref:SET domain-containing protein n=1 Tax=Rhizochromulina marina TaxID=1034831 RepID=A0A7S2WW23_9STRA|mmetsp:Transcript_9398/g.26540  ORF Transcript_9398/g.26540 Transcript_9398/m.26540 type:complete len:349 (+) Transcript_9398:71-1117(+)|eukprot:CAMPEP_0118971320 /NCGR_PEP_ID=MMETSP1173-20130426/7978_1 /TAXON_ID=1034831 /ORGANISM="Rhizochromulina marina cf, Strain CCMP1243" /LENGTH=348 /DNA_ID=CAMNT_0006920761 /DNA_START=36 /DNA_END=1082 /DNA_ORIENTATION=-
MARFLAWAGRQLGVVPPRPREVQQNLDLRRATDLAAGLVGQDSPRVDGAELHALLTPQVQRLFAAALEADRIQVERRHRYDEGAGRDPDDFGGHLSRRAASSGTGFPAAALRRVEELLGFHVAVQESSIAGAGRGLFLKGRTKAGTVIALYPGTVLLPGHIMQIPNVFDFLYPDDGHFLFSRYDGALIDARGAAQPPLAPDEDAFRRHLHSHLFSEPMPTPARDNIFGVGHLSNHPPAGSAPNAMMVGYDFESSMFRASADDAESLASLIPNAYFRPPSLIRGTYSPTVMMQSVILLATRDLEDEEVLTDYRLSPNQERPAWYAPVDSEEELRRWNEQAPVASSSVET